MKKTVLFLALVTALGLTACGSTKTSGLNQPSDASVAVKDQRLSTDFTDQGVKIYYTLTGKVDRIEVTGQASVWKGNVTVLAEADAMDKLVKFVHGKTVTSDRRVRILARSLDRAKDKTVNQFQTVDGEVSFKAIDLDSPASTGDESKQENVSRRVADRLDNTLVTTVTTITAKGRLTGIRKVRDEVRQDGKLYVAVYQWSEKDQDTSEFIRSRMR